MTLHVLLSKIPAGVKTHLRALAAVALFAALHIMLGGGTLDAAVQAAGAAALPVLLKWIDPTEGEYGVGATGEPQS